MNTPARLAAAEQTLADLEAEQADLPARLKQTAGEGDPHLWLKLHSRADAISDEIQAARLEAARLRLAAARTVTEQAEAQRDEVVDLAGKDRAKAKTRIAEAEQALSEALDAKADADRRARDARTIVPDALVVQEQAEEALRRLGEDPDADGPPRPRLARTVTTTRPGSAQRVTFKAGTIPPRWVQETVKSANAWERP